MPTAFLLQAAEITKTATEAAGTVTRHAAESGPAYALLWLLVVVLAGISLAFYLKAEKAQQGQQEAINKAVSAAREEWARQQAFDNGHAADLLRQSREQEREALDRLEVINRELRQQEVKSVEVIGGVRQALGQLSAIMHGVQTQLQSIESLLTGRTRPPFPPTHETMLP